MDVAVNERLNRMSPATEISPPSIAADCEPRDITTVPPPTPGRTDWPWSTSSVPAAPSAPAGIAWPRISIVTPSFNQADYLEETLRSVLMQGYPNLEFIVIDGGSADGSRALIERYEPHLAYWVSEPDHGQAHALNKGFARATGDIFGFLNSDDVYQPHVLFKAAHAYVAHDNRPRFWHAFTVEQFDSQGRRFMIRPRGSSRLADWADNRPILHQPGVFWSRELHHDVGGFDEQLEFAFDRKFFMAARIKEYNVTCEPDFVATRFRYHAASKTARVADKDNWGFAPEFIAAARWMQLQASLRQKLQIAWGRIVRPFQERGESLLRREAMSRLKRLGELLLSAVVYPPIVTTRFYWGAVRNVVRGTYNG